MTKRILTLLFSVSVLACLQACTDSGKVSMQKAEQHLAFLSRTIKEDVREVRDGLPKGAEHLERLYKDGADPKDDLKEVRTELLVARDKVQDLRLAKSTFFAVADLDGMVLRNDQDSDEMAGKGLFHAFPALKQAAAGKYVETIGSMPEAARVKGPDGQWVAAAPIQVGGVTKGLYVTGWSWSAYAYRLENAIRSEVQDKLGSAGKMPLLYVYCVVGKSVYGAPVSPAVNGQAITKLDPMSKVSAGHVFATKLNITGREFGLAVEGVPELGPHVGVAVLRSET
jgi:hypothetical protein